MAMPNPCSATILLVLLTAAASCEQPSTLGSPCRLASSAGTGAFDVEEPNIACESRLCLRAPSGGATLEARSAANGACTQACTTDDDCSEHGGSCASGFACAVPITDGAFCCVRLCVCRDDLARLPGPRPIPAACDAGDPANRCANLPGR
jgi:hypothetical protein